MVIITQNTFTDPKAILYLVSTPIGNMLDLTFRALEILKKVDYIFAEDTRRARKILHFYKFTNELISLHKYNEKKRIAQILSLLKANKQLALISNAGTPLISDPGILLVRTIKKAGFHVSSVPGASSLLSAFSISTFDIPFIFLGFLPKSKNKKTNILVQYRFFEGTLIIYESPLRIKETLLLVQKQYQIRNVALLRELTKKFETIIHGDINEVIQEKLSFKGEYVLVIEGNKSLVWYQNISLEEHIMFFLKQGYSRKEALNKVAKERKIPKKTIYHKYCITNNFE
ncbi:16S rRNA (cytidine(1402)-2'-O)-methyltransferase [Candidatus Phytoplasma melaleucae]|uniref:Ribosomal RNA small subunit methyltransferase I n=1 Tax=Candidatus Phytoplasma melaleucae TaxID=2982630 RepID=A0ABT9DE64_9MOLU|nr:16S rRNA (cytidine(1402)-2'-O)-methyltransferase ['Melaleuca sp.' phytoplasma]MDO8168094.1 16S rRNA (cytidine(1402)-2'-O)-methyltransferase ['Melaleuca sp.' phytoplasma]